MTWAAIWKAIPILLEYLPEIIDFCKLLSEKAKAGITRAQIRSEVRQIMTAFGEPDPVKRAKGLNDIFKGKP